MSSISPELLFADSAWLRGLTRRLVRDPEAAADLEQEVTLAALSRPRPAGRAWLATVARNLAALVHRRSVREARRLERLARPEAEVAAGDLVEAAELQQRAVAAVLALPPKYRDTILLRFLRGMSIEATAQHLGVPVETVRTRQKRALAQLRSQLLPSRSRFGALAALLPVGFAMKVPVVVTAVAACLLLGLLTVPLWYSEAATPPSDGAPSDEAPAAQAATMGAERLDHSPPDPVTVPQDPVREAVVAPEPVTGPASAPPTPVVGRGDIQVTVTRADGSPGAEVRVLCRRSSGPAQFAKTDTDGVARFAGLRPGGYSVASASVAPRAVAVEAGSVASVSLELLPGRRLTGLVLDPDGVPVAAAEVFSSHVGQWPAWPYVIATTDRNGRFDVANVGPQQSIGARHPEFGVSHRHVLSNEPKAEGAEELTIRFEAGADADVATVHGRVVDPSRRPIADAWVQISRQRVVRFSRDGGIRMPPSPALARSGEDGKFTAEWLGTGDYDLFVYAPGYAPHRQKIEVRVDSRAAVEVQLARGATLVGVVRDEDGQPAAGAQVRLPQLKSPQRMWVRVPDDGSYRFEDVPQGSLVVEVFHKGYSRVRETVDVGGVGHHELDVELKPGGTITGRLVDANDQPIVGWSISRRGGGRYARSDAEGRFRLADCKPEGNRLYIREAYGYVPYRLVLPNVPASAAERVIRVGAETEATARVTGQCVDQSGVPLAGVRIQLVQEGSVVHQATMTGDDGAFEVGPLPPGRYRVRPLHQDYEFQAVERELTAHAIEDLQQLRSKAPR
ncbi:MAG: sigma-70 family RNA polymerase sigma factor [bacterium]|nr:sigma-70 family RNA polymerase sigma factor [bacterium]